VSDAHSGDVLFAVDGGIGRITLNRPKAINALTHDMVRSIDTTLAEWSDLPSVGMVLLDGAGERGFCAGGDIRALYEDAKAGRLEGPSKFFYDEYRLNARIARYAKPIVAFMDGIVMGGGIGLSAHASHRVVTQRSMLAMPEVGIGFVPDVGGTFLLGRAPRQLGMHAALTGGRLGAADAILCGLADYFVPQEGLADLALSLRGCATTQDIGATIERVAATPPEGVLGAAASWIETCYAAETVEQIMANLEVCQDAAAALREIGGKSPTSVKVAFRLLHEARLYGRLEPCLQQEYRAALASMRSHDFVEGVRAAVVDKDRSPRWSPAALKDVTPEMVEVFFETSPETDLGL